MKVDDHTLPGKKSGRKNVFFMDEIVFSKYTMPPDDTMVILKTMKTVTEPVCGKSTKSADY